MNTWIVGHVPIGHYISSPILKSDELSECEGERIFFMKGRIMAGQADLEGNLFGLEDFKWLTKEEVKRHVSLKYYSSVKNIMSDR
jgi:large subunit ribosomal protein L46